MRPCWTAPSSGAGCLCVFPWFITYLDMQCPSGGPLLRFLSGVPSCGSIWRFGSGGSNLYSSWLTPFVSLPLWTFVGQIIRIRGVVCTTVRIFFIYDQKIYANNDCEVSFSFYPIYIIIVSNYMFLHCLLHFILTF